MRQCTRCGESAFTLIEVLAAVGICAVLGGALLYAMQGMMAAARQTASQQHAYVQLSHLIETWNAEASSALAIFVPSRDVLGTDNSDGHELDFYSRDASRAGHFWAYRWERSASTLQRYTYSVPGQTATASDPALSGITAFSASRKAASSLGPAFANGYAARDVAVNFGYPEVDGGNAIADVIVGDAQEGFELELLPGTMTGGFSVVVATFTPAPSSTFAPTATPIPAGPTYRIVPYTGYTFYPCVHPGPTHNCSPYPIQGEQCDVSYDGGTTWTMLFWNAPAVSSCPRS